MVRRVYKMVEIATYSRQSRQSIFSAWESRVKTKVKAFQMIQNDTQQVVSYLQDKGYNVLFELVPGNHFQYGKERLNRAFTWMFD